MQLKCRTGKDLCTCLETSKISYLSLIVLFAVVNDELTDVYEMEACCGMTSVKHILHFTDSKYTNNYWYFSYNLNNF